MNVFFEDLLICLPPSIIRVFFLALRDRGGGGGGGILAKPKFCGGNTTIMVVS